MNVKQVTNCLNDNYESKQISDLIGCYLDDDGCKEMESLTKDVKKKCDLIDVDLDDYYLPAFQDALHDAWDMKVENELSYTRDEFVSMFRKMFPESWYYNELGSFENVFNLKNPEYPYDKWGAKGWKDCEGNAHYGEAMYWYPVYDDLEKNISDQLEICKELLDDTKQDY